MNFDSFSLHFLSPKLLKHGVGTCTPKITDFESIWGGLGEAWGPPNGPHIEKNSPIWLKNCDRKELRRDASDPVLLGRPLGTLLGVILGAILGAQGLILRWFGTLWAQKTEMNEGRKEGRKEGRT